VGVPFPRSFGMTPITIPPLAPRRKAPSPGWHGRTGGPANRIGEAAYGLTSRCEHREVRLMSPLTM
jgi:hypothetical protein